jgi:hypothetical protein
VAFITTVWFSFGFVHIEVNGVLGVALVLDSGGWLLLHLVVTWSAVLGSQLGRSDVFVVAVLTRVPVSVTHAAVLVGHSAFRSMVLDPADGVRHDGLVASLARRVVMT